MLASALSLLALVLAGASDSTGATKSRNPLAGNWVGMTNSTNTYSGAPAPLSYRITRNGAVINFTTTVTLDKTPGGDSCPNPIQATVTMAPVKMTKTSTTYPKGKRFDFNGTGGSPPGALRVTGKINSGFRLMEGGIVFGGAGTVEVSPGVLCRTGAVHWTARRK